MWKYNKYNIGDVVGHKETPTIKFRVIGILCGVPEKKGNYLYESHRMFEEDDETDFEELFTIGGKKYSEEDLFLVRNPTQKELKKMLKEVLPIAKYYNSLAGDISKRVIKKG